jgi:hypothetical protein
MQLCKAHLLVVSDFPYLQNSVSGYENTVIFRLKTMFLQYRLWSFEDMENGRRPKDAPRKAAEFTYEALNSLINIGGLNWAVCLKNH